MLLLQPIHITHSQHAEEEISDIKILIQENSITESARPHEWLRFICHTSLLFLKFKENKENGITKNKKTTQLVSTFVTRKERLDIIHHVAIMYIQQQKKSYGSKTCRNGEPL